MKNEILDIAKKLYHNHLTPETATNLLLDLFDVSHSASKNEDWAYKNESWRNPYCQIRETATGKVIKDFGVTVHRT